MRRVQQAGEEEWSQEVKVVQRLHLPHTVTRTDGHVSK